MTEITFRLTKEEVELAQKFMKEKALDYVGAIGGQFTFEFTITSIGQIITVLDSVSGERCDVTDYDNF